MQVKFSKSLTRVLFIGSAEFAIPSFDWFMSAPEYEVVGIVSQPDRPVGRKRKLQPTSLINHARKNYADDLKQKLKVYLPEKIKQQAEEILSETNPDLVIVVAYGQMIPKCFLHQPKFKALNLHGSLLPQYRGAIPIEMALLNGDSYTGVSILQMTPGLDDGDVLAEKVVEIQPLDHALNLRTRIAKVGAELWENTLSNWTVYQHTNSSKTKHKLGLSAQTSNWAPQSQQTLAAIHGRDLSVCYSKQLNFEQANLQLPSDSILVSNKVRAFAGASGAWFLGEDQKSIIKIWRVGNTEQIDLQNFFDQKKIGGFLKGGEGSVKAGDFVRYKKKLYLVCGIHSTILDMVEVVEQQQSGKSRRGALDSLQLAKFQLQSKQI